MNWINFVEVGVRREKPYRFISSLPDDQLEVVFAEMDDEYKIDFINHTIVNILLSTENRDKLSQQVLSGEMVVGDTGDGSYAVGHQSIDELTKAAKARFGKSTFE